MKAISALLQMAYVLIILHTVNLHKHMTQKNKHSTGWFGKNHSTGNRVKKFNIIAQPKGPHNMMVLMKGRDGKIGEPGPQGDSGTNGLIGSPGPEGDKGTPGECLREQCESQELKALMLRLQALEKYLNNSESQPSPNISCQPRGAAVQNSARVPCASVLTTAKPVVTIVIQGGLATTAQPLTAPQQQGTPPQQNIAGGQSQPSQQQNIGANPPQQIRTEAQGLSSQQKAAASQSQTSQSTSTGTNPPQQPVNEAQGLPSQPAGTGTNPPQQAVNEAQGLPSQPTGTGTNPPQQPVNEAQGLPSKPKASVLPVNPPPATTVKPQPTAAPAVVSTPGSTAAKPGAAAALPLPPAAPPLSLPQIIQPPAPPPSPMNNYNTATSPIITINSTIQAPGIWISSGNGQMDLQQVALGSTVVMPPSAGNVQYPAVTYQPLNIKKHNIPKVKHSFMKHTDKLLKKTKLHGKNQG